jgi:hypothetical protein
MPNIKEGSTGQVMRQMDYEQKLHSISFAPIHKSIQSLIPHLEQRQECGKRLYEYRSKLSESEIANYEELIKRCESQITILLNFISNEQRK